MNSVTEEIVGKHPERRKVPAESGVGGGDCVDLRLYVANRTPRCLAAYENIKRICEEYAGGRYRIRVIDLKKNPEIAREDQITAIPTLIRVPRAEGRRKIIGTLADTKKVLAELDLPPKADYYSNGARGKMIMIGSHRYG